MPEICPGCLCGSDIRFADDLDQRHTGSVVIHHAHRTGGMVDQFARILFHMNPGDADGVRISVYFDFHVTVDGNGQFILGDLISLG